MGIVYDTLEKYWDVGVAVAIGFAYTLLSREALIRELMRGVIPAVTVIAVLAATLYAFVRYISATNHELRMAKQYGYVEHITSPDWEDLAMVFILALCLGALIAFVTNPLVYAIAVVILQGADWIGTCVVNRRVRKAYDRTPNIPTAIVDYYLLKPHLFLRGARFFGYGLGLAFALIARFRFKEVCNELAWLAIVTTTVATEFKISQWRNERNAKLHPKKIRTKKASVSTAP